MTPPNSTGQEPEIVREARDGQIIEMARVLHSHLPEDQRPIARMDFSDDQWSRMEAAFDYACLQATLARPDSGGVENAIEEVRTRFFNTRIEPNQTDPITGPWFVIDQTTAEPEVNWPGELIHEATTKEEARAAADRWCCEPLTALLVSPKVETADHDEAQRVGGRDLALGTATPSITHSDACRLSRAFNEASDLRSDEDRRINDWLKELIALAGQGGEGLTEHPQAPPGYVVVPVEPTREMWAAMGDALMGHRSRHHDKVAEQLWAAVLAARPVLPEQGGE